MALVEEHTMRGLFLAAALTWFESRGGDAAVLCRKLGVARSQLEHPDIRVSASLQPRMLNHMAEMLDDPCIGLHMGEEAQLAWWDVLGYAWANARNFHQILLLQNRYIRLMNDATQWALEQSDGRVSDILTEMGAEPEPARHLIERNIAAAVRISSRLLGVEFKPDEIHFRHARPDITVEHERILGAPLKFGQPDNRIVFKEALLKLPVRGADPQLGQVLERILEATLETLPDPNDFIQTVRCRISEIISFGEPTLDSVAERMALSGRTLQRRLESEGATWQELLDSLRKELALKYVMDSGVSSSSIAFLLGYGEVTSFNRAFRRWTGMPPGEYRKKNTA